MNLDDDPQELRDVSRGERDWLNRQTTVPQASAMAHDLSWDNLITT
jgi:hypothetical protein